MEKYAGRFVRLIAVMVVAIMATMSVHTASAQTATLNVVIYTEDGSEIPEGTVSIRGEGTPLSQDVGGNPSGREFSFGELQNNVAYEITINAGDYLEIVDSVTLGEGETTVEYTLEREVTPPTPSNLPDTGSGPATETGAPSSMLLVAGSFALALSALGLMLRRRTS